MRQSISTHITIRAIALAMAFTGGACKGDDEDDGGGSEDGPNAPADLEAGATAIVVVLNPVANEGHATGSPGSHGDVHEDVDLDAEPGGESRTDPTGLAVVEAEPEPTILHFGPDPVDLPITVVAAGDVYDAAVAYDGDGAAFFDNTPIRYAVGDASGAIHVDPDTPISDIEDELSHDDAIVVLGPGTYDGDLVITGRGVLLFGEGFSESTVTITGSIDARGEEVRLRGLTIEGGLMANGNNFGMSFSVVHGPASITGNGGAFLRNVFCGDATVPSSNATLLDNHGVAPLDHPPDEICNPNADATTGDEG